MSQVHIAPYAAQHYQRPEQECQAEKEIARHTMALLVDEHHADEEGRKHQDG